MKWLRLYHDTTTDPKWRLVAADSGQPVGTILSVWLEMLICASKAADRGTLEGWDDRVVAAHLGYRTDAVVSIREAMQGVVLDGMRLTGWDKRQRQGSDDAAERQRRARANKQETPPDDTGGGVHYGPNGAAYSGQSAENGASRDKAEMSRDNEPVSRDNEAMSRERHATNSNVTENPLSLTNLPTPTLNNSGGGGAGGRAREVGEYVAGKAGLKVQACIDRAAKWIAAGFDVHADIIPTVDDLVRSAKEPIGTPQYFDRAIKRHFDARNAPLPSPLPPNVSFLSGAGGRRGGEDPAITRLRMRQAEEQARAEGRGAL